MNNRSRASNCVVVKDARLLGESKPRVGECGFGIDGARKGGEREIGVEIAEGKSKGTSGES